MSAVPFSILFAGLGFLLGGAIGQLFSTLPVRRTPVPFSVACHVVSAIAAVAASSAPTGVRPFDAVLRIGVGSAFVAATAKARRWAVCLGAAVIVLPMVAAADAQLSSVALGVATLTLGAAYATYLHPDRAPLIASVLGIGLGQSALRMPTSLPARVPSVLVVVAIAVLTASAWRNVRKKTTRRIVQGVAVLGILGFLGSIAGSVALLEARTKAQRGVDQAREGLKLARTGDREAAEKSLAVAQEAMLDAQAQLRGGTAKIGLLVPVMSQHIRSVERLTGVAANVIASARTTSGEANVSSFKSDRGQINLDEVRRLTNSLSSTIFTLDRAKLEILKPSGPWLLPQVANKLSGFVTDIDDANKQAKSISELAQVLPSLLGGEGERHYLLVLPTPAEARGSGGLIGNYGVIDAVDGKLSLANFQRHLAGEADASGPYPTVEAPADFLKRYKRFGVNSQTLVNVNMSPDFPAAAQAIASIYPQIGGRPVDGVISADPIVLADLLGILGDVKVPGWPDPIGEKNAVAVMLNESYVKIGGNTPERLNLLADVTNAVWAKLKSTSLPNPKVLVDKLGPAVKTRHLQMWMRDPAEQAYLTKVGISGAIPPVRGDSFGVVVNNGTGNKIEYYLHRTIDYRATVTPPADGAVQASVAAKATITLRNDAPTAGAPDYVIGTAIAVNPPPVGTNVAYVSIYSPLQLTGLQVDGKDFPSNQIEVEYELGRNVYSMWIPIPSKAEKTITASFAGPAYLRDGKYFLDLLTQPLVNPDETSVRVSTRGSTVAPKEFRYTGPNSVASIEVPLAP